MLNKLISDSAEEVDAERTNIGGSSGGRRRPMAISDFLPGGGSGSSLLSALPQMTASQLLPTQPPLASNAQDHQMPTDCPAHDYLSEQDPNNPRFNEVYKQQTILCNLSARRWCFRNQLQQIGANEGGTTNAGSTATKENSDFLSSLRAHRNFFILSSVSDLQNYFETTFTAGDKKQAIMYSETANKMLKAKGGTLTGLTIASSKMMLGSDSLDSEKDSNIVPVCDWTVSDAIAYPIENITAGAFARFPILTAASPVFFYYYCVTCAQWSEVQKSLNRRWQQ